MAKNKAHFEKQGRALHAAGLLIFFGAPRSWQHAAIIRGYKQAQKEWREAHPMESEWDAAAARNAAFCQKGLAYN